MRTPEINAFLGRVHLRLAGGMALAGWAAWLVADTPGLRDLLHVDRPGFLAGYTRLGLMALAAPLAVTAVAGWSLRDGRVRGARSTFWLLSGLVGASLSLLALQVHGAGLATAFFAAAGGLVVLSLPVRRRHPLSPMNGFLTTALSGIPLAAALDLMLQRPVAGFAVDQAVLVMIAALAAWNIGRLKALRLPVDEPALSTAADLGALGLFLELNPVQRLLDLRGPERE